MNKITSTYLFFITIVSLNAQVSFSLENLQHLRDKAKIEEVIQESEIWLQKPNLASKDKAKIYLLLSEVFFEKNDFQEGLEASEHAYEQLEGVEKDIKLQADVLYQQAFCLYELQQYDAAQDKASAAEILQNEVLQEQEIERHKVWFLLAKIAIAQAKAPIAQDYLQKCQTNLEVNNDTKSPAMAAVYMRMGETKRMLAHQDTALIFYQKARELFEELGEEYQTDIATVQQNIGYCQKLMGRFVEAIHSLDKAAELYGNLDEGQGFRKGVLYNTIGFTYNDLGDHYHAMDYFEKGEEIFRKKFGEESVYLSWIYLGKGITYKSLRQYDKALEYHQKGLTIELKQYGEVHPNVAYRYNNIGECYMGKGEYATALEWHEKSLPVWLKTVGEQGPDLAIYYENVAVCYSRMEENSKAIEAAQSMLMVRQIAYGKEHLETASAHNQLAFYQLKNQELDAALENLDAALGIIGFDVSATSFEKVNAPRFLLDNLLFTAQTWQEQYIQNEDTQHLIKAEQFYQLALELIQFIKSSFVETESQVILAEKAHQVYEGCLELAFLQNKEQAAFEYNEKSKAQHLLEHLKGFTQQDFAHIPKSKLQNLESLQRQLSQKREGLFKAEKADNISDISLFQKEVFASKQQLQQFLTDLEKTHPQYFNLKYSNQAVTVEQVQQNILSSATALIEYFLGEEELYIFCIQKDDFFVEKVPVHQDFLPHLGKLQEALTNQNLIVKTPEKAQKQFNESALFLYDFLLKNTLNQLDENIKQLVLIPDGILGYLPFEVLLTEAPAAGQSYKNYDYLFKKYHLAYTYSATLLQEQQQIQQDLPPHLFAGFAPDYKDFQNENEDSYDNAPIAALVRSGMLPLPGAVKEVSEIALQLDGHSFLKKEASETQFKTVANQYRILHFSMHTLMEDENPMYSKLLFTPTADSFDDGFLHAAELYNMPLKAEMAVLSACNTGYGQLHNGEGIMSLSRAFTYSGIPSTVMSLWKVPDAATSEIMRLFYSNLKKGMSKDAALNEAKREYLKNTVVKEQEHPFYWAGFIAAGDMGSLEMGTSLGFGWWILVFSVVIGGLVFFRFWGRK